MVKTLAALADTALFGLTASLARSEPPQPDVKETVRNGLNWLARKQAKDRRMGPDISDWTAVAGWL